MRCLDWGVIGRLEGVTGYDCLYLMLFDLSDLKDIAGTDKEFIKDMLSTFIRSSVDGVEQIVSFAEEKNWEGNTQYTHKLSSPVKHIKASTVFTFLDEIERELKSTKQVSNDVIKKSTMGGNRKLGCAFT